MEEFVNGDQHSMEEPAFHPQRAAPGAPLAPNGQAEAGSVTAASGETPHDLEALIVDDDKGITYTFAGALRKAGYRCEVANTPKGALYKLAFSEPDLVLLDLRIGHEIDGEDILLQIRTNPRLDHTSVIVISAYPEMTPLVAELADLVMVKPVEVGQLQNLSRRFSGYRSKPDRMHINDPLTGLYNRNFFYTRLEHAMQRAKRRPDFLFATLVLSMQAAERENGDAETGDSENSVLTARFAFDTPSISLRSGVCPIDCFAADWI